MCPHSDFSLCAELDASKLPFDSPPAPATAPPDAAPPVVVTPAAAAPAPVVAAAKRWYLKRDNLLHN